MHGRPKKTCEWQYNGKEAVQVIDRYSLFICIFRLLNLYFFTNVRNISAPSTLAPALSAAASKRAISSGVSLA